MEKARFCIFTKVEKFDKENMRNCLNSFANQNYKYFFVVIIANPSDVSEIYSLVNEFSAIMYIVVYGVNNPEDSFDEIEYKVKKLQSGYCLFIDSNDSYKLGLFAELNEMIDDHFPQLLYIGVNSVTNTEISYPYKYNSNSSKQVETGIEFMKRNIKKNIDYSELGLYCIKTEYLFSSDIEYSSQPYSYIYIIMESLFKTKEICTLNQNYYNMNKQYQCGYSDSEIRSLEATKQCIDSIPPVLGKIVKYLSKTNELNENDNKMFYGYYIKLIQAKIQNFYMRLIELVKKYY